MKKSRIFIAFMVVIAIAACNKNSTNTNAQGGLLPTNYITILDSGFTPTTLTVSIGSSLTFVNNTTASHTIISDDTVTIKTPGIASGSSFYFKKDTLGTFFYHCKEHPTARASVTFRP